MLSNNRITVNPFSIVPELPGLPEIKRPNPPISDLSSRSPRGLGVGVDLSEGCMITNVVKYTHNLHTLLRTSVILSSGIAVMSRTQSRLWPSFRSWTLV
ncbi:hypothetical protein BGW80DRAFT_346701 [Lactifluus volemus]|nr:hypothetical protein BGW80DRAFT_346701 [Lactifluus volemus]